MRDCSRRKGQSAILRRLAVPPPICGLTRISNSCEPLKNNCFTICLRLLHYPPRDSVQELIYALFFSPGGCELLGETPVERMSTVELGAPNPIESMQSRRLGEVVNRPVAPDH